jgi:hypothetical protein
MMVLMNNGPHYRLTLEPARSNVPIAQRLRALLKYVLRACNLRCLVVEELPPEPAPCPRTVASSKAARESPRGEDRPV